MRERRFHLASRKSVGRTEVLDEGVVEEAAEDDAHAVAGIGVQQALPVVALRSKHQHSVQCVLPHWREYARTVSEMRGSSLWEWRGGAEGEEAVTKTKTTKEKEKAKTKN
jgi:hypothetical protein